MPLADFKELNPTELANRLRELKEALFNLRFQNATGQLDDTSQIRALKKDVARCETLLRAHEIAAAEELQARQGADQ